MFTTKEIFLKCISKEKKYKNRLFVSLEILDF